MRFGIDFGTTHTVVAYADRGNYPVLSFADAAGDYYESFPSVVAESGGELLFGFDAVAAGASANGAVLRSIKRLLSEPNVLPSAPVAVGKVIVPLSDLLTGFLSAVREAIVKRSNLAPALRKRGLSDARCAIAVPAHAHGAQRFITLDAFRRAGFDPVVVLNEPSAAGFEFTHRHHGSLNSVRDHVVVYDLGGGTFDASLMRIRGKHHEVVQTSGLPRLGGDEFDQVLLDMVLHAAKIAASDLDHDVMLRLRDICRDSKERLSPNSKKITVDLDAVLAQHAPAGEVTLPVSDYYDACSPLIDRTMDAMAPLLASLEGVLAQEPRDVSALAGVYVVGGASSLPLVPRLVRARFGRRVHKSPYPSAAVAIGLAIGADETSGFALSDQFARTFGVFREAAAGQQITFDPIFTRVSRVPTPGTSPVLCLRSYRAAHNVGHFRFLECSELGADGQPSGDGLLAADVLFPFDAALCDGKQDLASVPIQRRDRGPNVEEEYRLDEHGMVAVTIRNLDANYQRVFHIDR